MRIVLAKNFIAGRQLELPFQESKGLIRVTPKLYRKVLSAVKREIGEIEFSVYEETLDFMREVIESEGDPAVFLSISAIKGREVTVDVSFSIKGLPCYRAAFASVIMSKMGIKKADLGQNILSLKINLTGKDFPVQIFASDWLYHGKGHTSFALKSEKLD